MNRPIIEINELGKLYRIGENSATLLSRLWSPLRGGTADDRRASEFWALRGVSLDVCEGDVLGLIGKNGAGKSTLLKILSRITEPSCGRAILRGRVASLLEVGTGFHPELTGRENIFLNGVILGMRISEVKAKFDEIVGFSEIGRFIDTPVKRYSSGMYVRLAFAIAAHLEPEVLLVDEVLAVGDAAFQRRCLGKMGEVAREGRTIIFVSHNMTAIQTLCSRAVWLEHGRVVKEGAVRPTVSEYLRRATVVGHSRAWPALESAPGNRFVRLLRVQVRPAGADDDEQIRVDTPIDIEITYWNAEPDAPLSLSVHVINDEGITVFASPSIADPARAGARLQPGAYRSTCSLPGSLLNDGAYVLRVLFVRHASEVVFAIDEALLFEVADSADGRGAWFGKWTGVVRPRLAWRTESVSVDGMPETGDVESADGVFDASA
jgi:lipopolysaccharide transport system ATP-binding protein